MENVNPQDERLEKVYREYVVTYKMKNGSEYIDKDHYPIRWELEEGAPNGLYIAESELQDSLHVMRWIKIDGGWQLKTDDIEAYRVEEGRIVERYETGKYRNLQDNELYNLGFEVD